MHESCAFQLWWYDVTTAIIESNKFTLVNTGQYLSSDEPYILAPQMGQVFYVRRSLDNEWYVVRKALSHDLYNILVKDQD